MACVREESSGCRCIFQNPRIVPISKWEYPIPKAKEYWQKFCDDEEKKMFRVRHSIPNLSNTPFTRYSPFDKNTFRPDSLPHALTRKPLKSILKRNVPTEATLPREPIFKISPPTPLKTTSKYFVTSENVEIISDDDGIAIENNNFPKENSVSESHLTLPTVSSNEDPIGRKVYPKGKCPLHRNEPAVKIFDDEIDQYLVQVDKFNRPVGSAKLSGKGKSKRKKQQRQRSKSLECKHRTRQEDVPLKPVVIDELDDFKDAPPSVIIPASLEADQVFEMETQYSTQRQKRIPKLKSASLLPSFARAVSESSSESYNTALVERQSGVIIKEDDSVDETSLAIFLPKLSQLPDAEQSSRTEVDNEASTSQCLLRVPDVSSHRQKHGLVKTQETESKANGGVKDSKPKLTKESELTANVIDKKIEAEGSGAASEEPDAEGATLLDKDEKVNERRRSSKNRHSLRYSVRCAYRALKFITANKKLDFEPKSGEKMCEESSSSSSTVPGPAEKLESFHIAEREARDDLKDEDCLFHRDVQRRLRKKWRRSMDPTSAECGDSSTATAKSIIIPTRSRSTSGTSNKFAFPETSRRRSASILDRLPPMSYPRKNQDRCLSCLCRSLDPPEKRKIDTKCKHTTLTTKNDSAVAVAESTDSCSSSITLPDFAGKFEETFYADDEPDDYQPRIDKLSAVSSRSQIKEEESCGAEASIKKEAASISATVTPSTTTTTTTTSTTMTTTTIQQRQGVDLSLLPKDRSGAARMATKSTSVSSEKSMHSSSPEAQSTDETESPVILAGEDSSNSKYLAPCHAPTILSPSLEHLRALRFKKTTSARREKSDEAGRLTTDTSLDEDEELRARRMADERRRAKIISETSTPREPKDDGKKGEPRKILTKTKSVIEKISDDTLSVRDVALRRGSSCLDFQFTGTVKQKSKKEEVPMSMDALMEDVLTKYLFRGNTLRLVSGLPRFSIGNFVEFAKEHLAESANAVEALEGLCDEFLKRVLQSLGNTRDPADAKRDELVKQLVKLMVDSKRYLNPEKFPSDLIFSSKQPPLCNSRLLRRILPLDIYNMVAPILGMPEVYPKLQTPSAVRVTTLPGKRHYGSKNVEDEWEDNSAEELVVHPPSTRRESFLDDKKQSHQRLNPYALFLKKPRRKAVTWRPLTEKDLEGYDPNATLSMRAKNITDKICHEFCEWFRSLGGMNEDLDEEVLKDMFEIDFSADVVRAMQITYMEMPTVPDDVARARRCPDATVLAATKKELLKDVKAERRPKKTMAFNTSLPPKLQFIPPNNRVYEIWLKCEHVPRDLETMEAVWKGITHLDSVKGFMRSLQKDPNVQLPEALKSASLIKATKPPGDDSFAHMELDIGQIHSLKVSDV